MVSPQTIITLVHGTWNRGAEWCKEGSFFRTRLSERLPNIEFRRFGWSGRNSFAARALAAKNLTAQLWAQIDQHPETKHYVVGHSHGGNIALYGLADERLQKRISGIVCLTPFLHATARNLGALGTKPIFLAIASITLFPVSVWFVVQEKHDVVFMLINYFLFSLATIIISWTLAHALKKWTVWASADNHIALPVINACPMLIMRAMGDEASAGLNASQFVSRVMTLIWLWTGKGANRIISLRIKMSRAAKHERMAIILLIVFLVCGWAVSLFPMYLANIAESKCLSGIDPYFLLSLGLLLILLWLATSTPYGLLIVGGVIQFVIGALGVILMMALALFAIPFGPRLALYHLILEISVDDTPPGTWVVHQLTPSLRSAEFISMRWSADLLAKWKWVVGWKEGWKLFRLAVAEFEKQLSPGILAAQQGNQVHSTSY